MKILGIGDWVKLVNDVPSAENDEVLKKGTLAKVVRIGDHVTQVIEVRPETQKVLWMVLLSDIERVRL